MNEDHYSLETRDWLSKHLPDRWIGRRGPIEWPARSPDLTPPDFFLWGYLKDKVYAQKSKDLVELKSRIENEIKLINSDLCKRVLHSIVDQSCILKKYSIIILNN